MLYVCTHVVDLFVHYIYLDVHSIHVHYMDLDVCALCTHVVHLCTLYIFGLCTLYEGTCVTVYHIRTLSGCKCVCALWHQEKGSRRDPRMHHLVGIGECRMKTVVCCNLVEIWQVTISFATI